MQANNHPRPREGLWQCLAFSSNETSVITIIHFSYDALTVPIVIPAQGSMILAGKQAFLI